MRNSIFVKTAIAGCFVLGSLSGNARADDSKFSNITTEYLYNTCKEGDNASREAEVAAMRDCDQYLSGFRDGALAAPAKGVCFPDEGYGASAMRKQFIKYITFHLDLLPEPAAKGVMAAMTCEK